VDGAPREAKFREGVDGRSDRAVEAKDIVAADPADDRTVSASHGIGKGRIDTAEDAIGGGARMKMNGRREKIDPTFIIHRLDQLRPAARGDRARKVPFIAIGARRHEIDRRETGARAGKRRRHDRGVEAAGEFENNPVPALAPRPDASIDPPLQHAREFRYTLVIARRDMRPRGPEAFDLGTSSVKGKAAAAEQFADRTKPGAIGAQVAVDERLADEVPVDRLTGQQIGDQVEMARAEDAARMRGPVNWHPG